MHLRFTAEEDSAFIDHLHPKEIKSGSRHPSILTNACAINYTANSLFEERLNHDATHNIPVEKEVQNRMKSSSTKPMQEMKSIHLGQAAATTWHNVNFIAHTLWTL